MEDHEILEREFGEWIGASNVVACSSGTAALHLALEALCLPPGSEVILPDLTMVACARAVTLAGLVPVFVDCNEKLLMSPDWVDEAISDETRAIMAVHVYGRRCDMDALGDLARKHDLLLIEDLAEAHGIKPHPITSASAWSFYRNKVVAGEEGGAVAFRDPKLADRAREMRSLGFTEKHDFNHTPRGHNYRLANALAAKVRESLRYVKGNLVRRRHAEAVWDEYCPKEWRMPKREVPWVYDLRVPGMTKNLQDRVVASLQEFRIPARHCFQPMSVQEEYRDELAYGHGKCYEVAREVIYLPLAGQEMPPTPELAKEVLRRIRSCL